MAFTLAKNVVALVQIGGTDKSAVQTISPWLLGPNKSWYDVFNSKIRPLYEAGIRRFVIWDPFGHAPGELLNLTTGVTNPGKIRTDGLYECIAEFARNKGCEIIVYLGQMPKDPLLSSARPTEWIRLVHESIRQFVDAGASIAFDNIDDFVTMGDKVERTVMFVAGLGIKTYIEPALSVAKASLLHALPRITVAYDLEKFPKKYASTGAEHIAFLGGSPPPSFGFVGGETGAQWNAKIPIWAQNLLLNGFTPCCTFNDTILKSGTLGISAFANSFFPKTTLTQVDA